MNAIFTAIANFFDFGQSLSPGINKWIETRVTVEQGKWAELAMKRRFAIALRQLKKNPTGTVKALVGVEFMDLSPELQADAVSWLTAELAPKK